MRLESFRGEINDLLIKSIQNVPIGSGKFISIKSIDIAEPEYGLSKEIDAKFSNQTLGTPVRSKFELYDETTGEKEYKTTRLFRLPTRTARGTYIWNGNEVNIKNQYRRRPGVYTSFSSAEGGVYSANFNMARGKSEFSEKVRIVINPSDRKYQFKIKDSKFDVYPILKVYGYTEPQIRSIMGDKLYEANLVDDYELGAKKLAKRLTGEKAATFEEAAKAIRDKFSTVSFAGGVNKYTLGREHEGVNKEFWGDVLEKLRNTAAGTVEQDDPDASYFREYLEPEDNIIEAIRSTSSSIIRKIKQRKGKGDLHSVLQNINFDQEVNNVFSSGSLKDIRDQTNPVDWSFGVDALTIYGTGGIGSSRSITDNMRRLQPSLIGFADPINTPEDGDKVGVVLHRSVASAIKDRIPHIRVVDKDGKNKVLPVIEFYHQKIGIGEPKKSGECGVIYKGQISKGRAEEVSYFIEESGLFSHTSNMIPMISSTYGVRANVASKQMGQALPLKDPDAPHVESSYMKGRKARYIEEGFDTDEFGNVRSVGKGVVERVSDKTGKITIAHEGGERRTYEVPMHYPLNSESFTHANIRVSAGDTVSKGQVIAESIFSKNGGLAIGKNLKTAMLPYKGYNFEDGFVISDTAAKKLTSLHMHKFELEASGTVIIDKKKYASLFPNNAAKINLSKYGDDGVILEGSTINYQEPVILAYERRELTPQQTMVASFNRTMANLLQPRDASVIYDIEFPGKVTRVYRDPKKALVMVESEEPAVEGDKIATRYGGKGIITKILPDAVMPIDSSGSPTEVLFNPHGVISRMNPSQMVEYSLGKVAEKTGKKYDMPGFSEKSFVDMARKELDDNNMNDEEDLIDPETGKKMSRVGVGSMYFVKLKHSVRKKMKAGDVGEYDTIFEQPKKTEKSTARGIDGLSLYSLLASGARRNLTDMSNIKSTRNDEFWRALQQGMPLPPTKETTTSKYFITALSSLGLNVNRTRDALSVTPATDKEILKRSNGEIVESKFIRSRDLKPEEGGFYDPVITGGAKGERWSHIDLVNPIPNPLFEEPIKAVLGLTKDKFFKILSGDVKVNKKGEIDPEGTLSGGIAFKTMLNEIDVNQSIKDYREKAEEAVKQKDWQSLDGLNRKIRILLNSKNLNQKLGDLYTISKFPVMPPRFRQMTQLQDGTIQNPPLNELYAAVKMESDGIKKIKELGLEDSEVMAKRNLDMYNHISAAFGLSDPASFALQSRAIGGGIMDQLSPRHKQSKLGVIGRRLLGKPQNLSGGSTIVVDPELPMDEVGVPYDMAKRIFRPFVMRKLVQSGYTPIEAIKTIEEDSPIAKAKLDAVIKERPILVNRHPSLHKYNFLSQWAKIVPGQAIQLNPLVTGGYNADFDGDSIIGNISVLCPEYSLVAPNGEIINHQKASIRISDFPKGDIIRKEGKNTVYSVPSKVFVPSITENGEPVTREVTEFHEHPGCDEWNVFLEGQEEPLIVSGDHSLACWNPETMQVEKYTPKTALNMAVPKICGYSVSDPVDFPGVTAKKKKDREDIICALGFMVGLMRRIKDRDISMYTFAESPYIQDIIKRLNKHEEISFENGEIYSPFVNGWIRSYILNESFYSLPSSILCAHDYERRAFVAGLIQSMGKRAAECEQIRGRSTKELVEDIATLMRSVGIEAKSFSYATDYTQKLKHFLTSPMQDSYEFYSENRHLFVEKFSEVWAAHDAQEKQMYLNKDKVPVPTWICILLSETMKTRVSASEWWYEYKKNVYEALSYDKWIEAGYELWPRHLVQKTLSHLTGDELACLPEEWLKIYNNRNIRWSRIVHVLDKQRKVTMYDLTVKDTMNFVADHGYVVWDTMNVHVPVSEGARLEAAKDLLPSKFLFGPDRKIMPMPSNESLLGLYLMTKPGNPSDKVYKTVEEAEKAFLSNEIELNDIVTIGNMKTSLGVYRVEEALPAKYRPMIHNSTLNKSIIQKIVTLIYKEDPSLAAKVLNDLKSIGYKYSYLAGFSISLSDFQPSKEITSYTKDIVKQFGDTPDDESKLNHKMKEAEKKFSNYFDKNRLYDMARSGAKGNWNNISQMLMAPGYLEGPGGEIGKAPVGTGYSEGMLAHDYLNTLYASRSGIISKVLGVARGGELAKNEVHTTIEIVITEKDCGTKNGIDFDRDDRYILGRYEASTGKEIDEVYLSTIKSPTIKVRSPITCNAVKGVCIKCYGRNDQMKIPSIGDHVGIDAAQSASERITQSLLRAFHGGRGAKEGGTTDLATQMHNLFGKMPKQFANEAPVALESGVVTKVEKSPAGGHDIWVGKTKYRASQKVDPYVKPGDHVLRGDQLTTGMKNPRMVLETEGLFGVRSYLSDSMRNMYKNTGVDMNPIHFEIVSRGLTEHAKVVDPGDSDFEIGDVETVATLDSLNKEKKYGIKYMPILSGADRVPVFRKDFLSQIARRETKKAIISAASEGRESKIHDVNPIPSWILGEFKPIIGKEGNY